MLFRSFDGVVGGVEEELPDKGEAFVVGDVRGWFEGPGLALFAIEVLRRQLELNLWSLVGECHRLAWDKRVEITVGVTAVPTVAVLKGIAPSI